MHIPDGYLSPSTCASFYAFSIAGWFTALKRIKRKMLGRTIPLISVFAAFCFVVMMFNVPLPFGTTGHAVGVAVAAIVLGPWGAMLAISIALAIQALFFGDGGITTLGANCFNMAIVGSLVAYGVFRLISGNSEAIARRRVWAAAIAGYVAINASSLLTAIELGIQPLLFRNASGVPLYAPYPLRVAVPAMMIGHLTIAGLAEAVIAAGMISYLQRADIGLLQGTAMFSGSRLATTTPASSYRRMWLTVALLMLFTPLGILAAGTAWGEWSAADLHNAATRAQIAAASRADLPGAVPAGIERWSAIWTAPFPGYAPSFIKQPVIGYLLSAMFGVGILLLTYLVSRSAGKRAIRQELRS